jgi:hypothetical protein
MNARTILFLMWSLGLFALCEPVLATWTEPVPLTEVNTQYQEWAPFLSFDGLSLYFSRVTNVPYDGRIYQATREEPSGPFTSVREISELNQSNTHALCPWVSPDNLRMYYYTESAAGWQLKFSERVSINDLWPQGTSISELNVLSNFLQAPKLTADELTIFFNGPEGPGTQGQYDMWMATRPDIDSPFSQARKLDEIDTASHECHPFPSADGLQLYFVSDRNSNFQLFEATRVSLDAPFGNVEHLSFFDAQGSYNQFPCLSYDGTAMYFMRQRGSDWSTRDIYVSYIPEPATLLLLSLGAIMLRKKH